MFTVSSALFYRPGLTSLWQERRRDALLLLLIAWLGTCLGFLLLGVFTPIDLRYYLAAFPPLAALAAAAIYRGALTVAWAVLDRQVRSATGLTQAAYANQRFGEPPLVRRRVTTLDLSILQNEPDLRRRSFSVRWQGYWAIHDDWPVDLGVRADGRVALWVDDRHLGVEERALR